MEDLALLLAVNCVRNTVIEKHHAGALPMSVTGDYCDVTVVTPYGEIPWNAVSRLSNDEMMAFNIEVANKLYTALRYFLDPTLSTERQAFVQLIARMHPSGWNKPQMHSRFVAAVARIVPE